MKCTKCSVKPIDHLGEHQTQHQWETTKKTIQREDSFPE